MVAAAALRNENAFEPQEHLPGRQVVLARYRRLREIGKQHHSDVMKFMCKDAIFHNARRVGLVESDIIVANSMDELTLAFDLAIYTAPPGRSTAIERYARSAQFVPGSDEALMVEAMRNARFAVVVVHDLHQSAGLIVTDLFRNIELWLVDEGLERSRPTGTAFATRYFAPDRFVMTAGVCIPVDRDLLMSALGSVPQLQRKPFAEAIEDRRFAEAVYRTAIADGIMEGVTFEDPSGVGEEEN